MRTGTAEPADLVVLARAAMEGDKASRDTLMAAARPLMLRWAARLVDDPAVVEDVVQDALIEVHRTLAGLREPEAVAGWLHLAVRKHADRHRRRRQPGRLLDFDLQGDAAVGSRPIDPADLAERTEDRAVVRRALALVKDTDRLLLVLRYYGDWPESDLAVLLGIRGGAVRKRLYDARRRLRVELATRSSVTPLVAATDPWEMLMTDVRALLGAMYDLDDPMPALPPGRPPLSRPESPGRLATEIKVLDTLVPLPRGGVVDLTGPIGTGHLMLVAEILHNLTAGGSAALVAVTSAERSPTGASARLWKLLDAQAPAAEYTAVVCAPAGREAEAVGLAERFAGWLAHGGVTVLLAVDEIVAERTGPGLFDGAVGLCDGGPGAVTGLRVAAHAAGAAPAAPWPGSDAEVRLGTAEMVVGQLPAVDVLASRSALLDGDALPLEERTTAHEARALLARAARIRDFLTQPLEVTEAASGTPGEAVPPQESITGLARLLA
ncbi:RNA polymerase sigma factor (sigma-70 family) [Kribbella orskensis]|uniref:RNA polymerase sigma factor (Sigma-70 family) n=1 Tax=Kribbella orskensis TaxID=2512216 RepID=A0ABY2BAT8_9ACTN|nr:MULTISPECIES: sigma-70 family RNA polymerase sigma factor [Kribbella]TCN33572.1 RNA polymerase sigma factor (sigma-70 family) [Kribbella sp. VKM Ac-2500]TCO14021.1 RNA polymerase sigma factor (sigma-70 family) [Kribbella orskensis]